MISPTYDCHVLRPLYGGPCWTRSSLRSRDIDGFLAGVCRTLAKADDSSDQPRAALAALTSAGRVCYVTVSNPGAMHSLAPASVTPLCMINS